MPVTKDPDGRRWVQTEAEVPGSPEDVWQAIATGPGVSSWFVPTEIEERGGGKIVAHFSPDNTMDSLSTITAWEPPHRFTADSRDDMQPGDPTIATEWIVEAKTGGTCVVRVVHSWYSDKDDWDAQYEQTEMGWAAFFKILRLYLTHFRGQSSAMFQLMGVAPEPKEDAWARLVGPLGLTGVALGQQVTSSSEAPPLAGLAEDVGPAEHPEMVLLRIDTPAPGLVHLFAMPMMGQIFLPARFFLYGNGAAESVASAEPVWQAWMTERFPPPTAPAAAPAEATTA
jgi:uncharacterized protein YndB with AHSA1/START domain